MGNFAENLNLVKRVLPLPSWLAKVRPHHKSNWLSLSTFRRYSVKGVELVAIGNQKSKIRGTSSGDSFLYAKSGVCFGVSCR